MKTKTTIVYGVVIEFDDLGQQINTFINYDEAIEASNNLINQIKSNNLKNINVYFSELEYDIYNNIILDENLINKYSKLLYKC